MSESNPGAKKRGDKESFLLRAGEMASRALFLKAVTEIQLAVDQNALQTTG
jgi:hypothetical protein